VPVFIQSYYSMTGESSAICVQSHYIMTVDYIYYNVCDWTCELRFILDSCLHIVHFKQFYQTQQVTYFQIIAYYVIFMFLACSESVIRFMGYIKYTATMGECSVNGVQSKRKWPMDFRVRVTTWTCEWYFNWLHERVSDTLVDLRVQDVFALLTLLSLKHV